MDKQCNDSNEQHSNSANPIVKENLCTETEENQAPKMLIHTMGEMEMSAAEKEVKLNGDSDKKDSKNEKSDFNDKEIKCDNVIISTNDAEENPGNNVEDSTESQASKNISDPDSKSQGTTVNKLDEAEIETKSEDKVLNTIKTTKSESGDSSSDSDLKEAKPQFEKITERNEPDRPTPEASVSNTNQKEETNVKGDIVPHSKSCESSAGEKKGEVNEEDEKLDEKNVHYENDKDRVENATCVVSFSKSETDSCASKKSDELNMSSTQEDSLGESVSKEHYDAAKDQESDDEFNGLEHDESMSLINEDSEGEFEDVEVPEEVDELIVPDEGKDLTNHSADNDMDRVESSCNENEHTKDNVLEADEDETTNSKSPEDEESNEEHLVPELVAIRESDKDCQISEDDQTTNDAEGTITVANDPLNCLETSHHSTDENDQSGSGKPEEDTNSDAYQEDDDDVEFVETRNSPICIESDEEDDSRTTTSSVNTQTICLPTHKIIIPKAVTVTRTSAKKSTARPYSASSSPQTVSTTGIKVKRFAYLDKATTYRRSLPATLSIIPQKVVATIEVLDSSDEDSQTTNNRMPSSQNLKTPPKRTLMAAKGANNNKVANKTFMARRPDMPKLFPTLRQQTRRPAPPPLPPPTPQSSFLTNVNLQPAATSGSNPPAFSALLSNKSVIIPNAFYGNHPNVRGNPADAEMERRYIRWLETFIAQFCNPQLVASHYCFVLLQRALKYKDYVRIKQIRKNLNVVAPRATDHINHQLMLDLRAMFLKSSKETTPSGRRFSEMACSTPQNKTVTLLIHASTGRIIMKSCNMEMPISATSSSNSAISPSTSTRKRQLDEDEYVPVKNKNKLLKETASASENFEDDEEGRKRSLRSKRSKRIDNSFSYNEDDLAEYDLEEEVDPEIAAQAEIQRKIEEKRLEAQKQRQQQAKSFENEFIQAFAKNLDGKELSRSKQSGVPGTRARATNSLSSTSMQQHLADNDAEDLLQATWIENVEHEDTQIISDDDEPKEHRIYKQMQLQKHYQQQMQKMQLQRSAPKYASKTTSRDNSVSPQQMHVNRHWPKNTDVHLHSISKNKDICAICKQNVQRIVHHYVNEHRGCEVYTSRLTTSQVEHLRRGASNIFNVSLYKNGQPQYEAHCIFCQKQSKFMLPYWIQHFTMHTGEYAYRCSGCGIRKPTRSLLTQHYSQCCPQNGSVLQDYTHDTKKIRVDARICTLCNFVQLHRCNIVKHLHQQHGVKQILPKHIQTIVLLKLETPTDTNVSPSARMPQQTAKLTKQKPKQTFASSSSANNNMYVIDDHDNDVNDNDETGNDDDTLLFGDTIKSIQEQQQSVENTQKYSYNYIPPYMLNSNAINNMTWEDNDPAEDLSYMICGMLDVQTNNE